MVVTQRFSKLVCTCHVVTVLAATGCQRIRQFANKNYRFYRTNRFLYPDFSGFSMWSLRGRLVFAFKHSSAPDLVTEVQG